MAEKAYNTYDPDKVIDHPLRTSFAGGPPGGNDLEARVTKLENQFDKLNDKVDELRIDVAVLKEKVSNLPGKGFIVSATVAALAFFSSLILFQERIAAFLSGSP